MDQTISQYPVLATLARMLGRMIGRWTFLCLGICVPTGVAAVALLAMDNWYTASATMVISHPQKAQGSSLLESIGMGSLAQLVSMGGGADYDKLITMSKSSDLALASVRAFRMDTVWKATSANDLKHENLERMWRENFDFSLSEENAILLQYKDKSPERATAMVRFVKDWLDSAYNALHQIEVHQSLGFIHARVLDREAKLRAAEDSLVQFQMRAKIIAPDEELVVSAKRIAALESTLDQIELERDFASSLGGHGSSDVQSLNERYRLTRDMLQRSLGEKSSGKEAGGNIQGRIEKRVTYERLFRQVERHGSVYKYLLQQEEMLGLDAAKNIPVLGLVDSIRVPEKKSGPKRMVFLEIVFFLSGCITTLLIVGDDLLANLRREVAEGMRRK